MKKILLFLGILLSIFTCFEVLAYDIKKDDKIYVSGETIGIKLNTGVKVVGLYGLYENGKLHKPWENAQIKEGDIIVKFNNKHITNIESLLNELSKVKEKETSIVIKRDNKEFETKIKSILNDNNYSLGLYVKDSIVGVGTLTYYIKEANIFGSLGHQMTNENIYGGNIYEAKVSKIIKPTNDRAGEKHADILNNNIGIIKKNTITGVHGYSNNIDTSNMKLLEYKTKDEINLGKAEIWTCIEGEVVSSYDINITNLEKQKNQDVKGISFEVIDNDLIKSTGGIIQGMSGSPIIQDNKIIGAVTHVLLNDSKKGYGIYLEFMFEDMGINIKK